MKPPHCLTQKCQKSNQLLSLWVALLGSSPWKILATLNCNISIIDFFQRCGIFVFETQGLVSFLWSWCNQLFYVSIKWLCPIEQASLLFVNHLYKGISRIIHNMKSKQHSNWMCTICHETFEIGVCKTKLKHHLV
jgi:hypothetical protein